VASTHNAWAARFSVSAKVFEVVFRDLVRKRRMIRRFEPTPVPRDTLLRVLEVARHAPAAVFSQGFDFVVLDTKEQLGRFWQTTDDPRFPCGPEEIEHGPSCIVLPIANMPMYLERYSREDKARYGLQKAEAWPVPFWDIDTAMAVMLILLAAVEEGLCCFFFGISAGERELLRELDVP